LSTIHPKSSDRWAQMPGRGTLSSRTPITSWRRA